MVTHDVSEAVYMSDRVIVMSLNKGEIVADIKIDLKHPRERDSIEYIEHVRELSNSVKKAFINEASIDKS
ncbi:hypothetical protein [Brachyspira pilosicoli]|nr:hypothetical protein [Brachyspira pilosicoli]